MTETRKWSLATVVAVVLLLAASWFLLIGPKRGEAASLRSDNEAQEQQNAQLVARIDQLAAQAKDLPAQERKLEAVRTKLPRGPRLGVLINKLSAAAESSGVKLVSLKPQTPTPLVTAMTEGVPVDPAAPADPAAAGAAVPGATGLYSIPITVTVSGGYYDVEQFFHKVESLRRAFLVSGFTVESEEAGGAGGSGADGSGGGVTPGDDAAPGDVIATITARVFMSADPTAATTPEPVPGTPPAPQTAGQAG